MNNLFKFDNDNLIDSDYIVGTDEAGRGPGAGPVFAASVCFKDIKNKTIDKLSKLNDSKQLSERVREELYEIIINNSVWSVKAGTIEEIEKYNILKTSLNTMQKACYDVISKLASDNVIVLVDGNKLIRDFKFKQKTIVKGDSKSAAIAAASIIAKVTRDRFMTELDKEFPMYNWKKNKGYMTKEHIDAVDKYGLTKWHRNKFFEKHFSKSEQLTLIKM